MGVCSSYVQTMALKYSEMLPLGTPAPAFSLPDVVSGRAVTLDDFSGQPGLLVMFICNHCPYVIHLKKDLATLAGDYGERGVVTIGVNANDIVKYPQDGLDKMAEDKEKFGYPFPYCLDEWQETAQAYLAAGKERIRKGTGHVSEHCRLSIGR